MIELLATSEPGWNPSGNGNESSCLALLGKHIHIGFVGVLQECLSTQSFYWVVSHSVAKNDNMFHLFLMLSVKC